MSRRIALTGATGFIGRMVLARLSRDGWQIQALTRRDVAAQAGVTWIRGDLSDCHALRRLVQGTSAVIHLAGLTHAASHAALDAANARGTAALAEAVAEAASDTALLYVSSLAARSPEVSAYAASKRRGEAAIMHRLPPGRRIILRPPVVYGAGDATTRGLLRIARLPVLPAPRLPRLRAAMISVEALADALSALTLLPRAALGGRFEIADTCPQGYTLRELLGAAAAAQGRAMPVLLPIPAASLGAAAWTASLSRHATLFGPDKAREIAFGAWHCDPDHLLPGKIWIPRETLPAGLAKIRQSLDVRPRGASAS